jgi:hypothetical protein
MLKNKYIGDLADNRKQSDKDKDFDSREIDLGSVKYLTLKQAEKNAKAYIERDQYSTSSCVPSSICNALWNTEKENLAQEPNYRMRSNFPNEGCYWDDQLNLAVNFGMAKRKFVKEAKTEKVANEYKITDEVIESAKEHKQASYVYIRSFDDLITAINTGYPVAFSVGTNSKEYANKKPKLIGGEITIKHAICAIPNTVYKDKDEIGYFITDSAHFGGYAKRQITKEFYENRKRFGGAYFIDIKYSEPFKWITPPQYKGYVFTRDLTIGSKGDDVLALQTILKANGLFPDMNCTEYFGGITRQAVKDFQKKYEKSILWIIGLTLPTGFFGQASQAKMEDLIA